MKTSAWYVLGLVLLAASALWFRNEPTGEPVAEGRFTLPARSPLSGALRGEDAPEPAAEPPSRARQAMRVWEAVDESAVADLPAYKELVEGRVLVRLPESAGGWFEGGELDFVVPQLGQTFPGVIERVEEDVGGNRSFVGLLREPDGSRYRFVVTIGARNQFANIATSRGTFELVAADGLGWLMPSASMDRHVDYSRPDFFIPDVDRRSR